MIRIALLFAIALLPTTAAADISGARYDAPTSRYPHAVLGDDIEWGALVISRKDQSAIRFDLPETRVFEDLDPRLVDLDNDGDNEVVVVESDARKGAQLAVYDETGKIASTPFIGTRFRWLAPAGFADFDGDGQTDIAYVETPHLGKTLRFWTIRGGELREIAALRGVTNHKIGEDFISSHTRMCRGESEVLLADASWQRIIGVSLKDSAPVYRDLGPWTNVDGLKGLAC